MKVGHVNISELQLDSIELMAWHHAGVFRADSSTARMWYRRTFTLPSDWADSRILLHFGAVDWQTTVTVNGRKLGTHTGG